MKKCNELSQALLTAYNERARGTRLPKIQLSGSSHDAGEGFQLSYAGGTLSVKSQSPLAELYAVSLLSVAVPSGHWFEFLGTSLPRFRLRPLWLRTAPADEVEFRHACGRTAELGYNAVIWDGSGSWSAIPGEYGLKAIVSAPDSQVEMEAFKGVDYVMHTGQTTHAADNQTLAETVLAEVRQLEASMPAGTNLIYYAPYHELISPEQSAHLILTLHRESAKGTCLAFSAVAGDPTHDYLAPHPLWDVLRRTPQLQGTGLLPIVNAGGLQHGEGLWPGVCVDQAELLRQGCRRHSFVGAIGLVNVLPVAGGFLDANLWVMAQVMWREISPLLLLDTWLRAHKSEPLHSEAVGLLKDSRELIVALGQLRMHAPGVMTPEEGRLLAEQALAHLRGIEMKAILLDKKRVGKPVKATVSDYLTFFIRDAKRLLKPHMPGVNIDDDSQESIWTKAGMEGSRKSVFLDFPNGGHVNSKIALIISEN